MMTNFSDLGFLRVAACSPQVSIGNPTANAKQMANAVEKLEAQGVTVGVFPELSLTGYSAEDLFFSETLIQETITSLSLLAKTSQLPLLVVGTPWRLRDGRLLNCAAVISDHRILGMVPKSAHPNHGEFYDLRWFSDGSQVNETITANTLGSFQIRTDQLFEVESCTLGIELCEDLWAPVNPSTAACLAGANLIANPSASTELITKADYRRRLVELTSAKNLCGYIYCGAGPTESSKDVVFGGHCLISECGLNLAESQRFQFTEETIMTEIDLDKIRHDRAQNKTFANSRRDLHFKICSSNATGNILKELSRQFTPHPFVPDSQKEFDQRAQEILDIQSTGLRRRMLAADTDKLVIGLSGGLDSTLALLVCLETLASQNLGHENLVSLTLPGPGTSDHTKQSVYALSDAAEISIREIQINLSVEQHLKDITHQGDLDVVYENAQARERTQILFDCANKENGIVVGTGDLSELALGWCTFNADHMSNYNVNVSVPKTMIKYLVQWYAHNKATTKLADVLKRIIDTPISPELIPPKEGEIHQKTEEIIGPYELHDFFIYHFLRYGASPTKIFNLAKLAYSREYSDQEIQKWIRVFFERFFGQQFKRTTLPPGPKIGSVSLSPRGDWRMPDEASAEIYLREIDQLTS